MLSSDRKTTPKTWTSPEQAAAEILETCTSRDLGPEHASRLSDLLGERVFPHLEAEEVLGLAMRLAELPTFTEVSAALTLVLRVAPLDLLCAVWREATSGASIVSKDPRVSHQAESARAALRTAASEEQAAIIEAAAEDDAITTEDLRKELALDSAMRVENADQALREAEAEDAQTMALNATQALAEAEAQDIATGATGEVFEQIRPKLFRTKGAN